MTPVPQRKLSAGEISDNARRRKWAKKHKDAKRPYDPTIKLTSKNINLFGSRYE